MKNKNPGDFRYNVFVITYGSISPFKPTKKWISYDLDGVKLSELMKQYNVADYNIQIYRNKLTIKEAKVVIKYLYDGWNMDDLMISLKEHRDKK